jgi:hypothetical protein
MKRSLPWACRTYTARESWRADLYAGPATRDGYLAPLGLPFRLRIEASFDRAAADLEGCTYLPPQDGQGRGVEAPGWGVATSLAVVWGAAALLHRTRRQG